MTTGEGGSSLKRWPHLWTAPYTPLYNIVAKPYGVGLGLFTLHSQIIYSLRVLYWSICTTLYSTLNGCWTLLFSLDFQYCTPVCSEYHFSLTNEYPNIFVTANYLQMNVWKYSVVYILTNECPNIFVHLVYSRINVQIYPNEKYWLNILANE